MRKLPPDIVVRAARLYRSNGDAAQALGISARTFARLCRDVGVETPWARGRRLHAQGSRQAS